ncbi:MAG: hypothetical protein ABGY11_07105, partial [Candidatus Thioglobus sp.]
MIFNKLIRLPLNYVSFIITTLIPVRRNLILFTGSSLSTYNESTKYLYEYLLKNKKVTIAWVTNSKVVYSHLTNIGHPVVLHRSLSG